MLVSLQSDNSLFIAKIKIIIHILGKLHLAIKLCSSTFLHFDAYEVSETYDSMLISQDHLKNYCLSSLFTLPDGRQVPFF